MQCQSTARTAHLDGNQANHGEGGVLPALLLAKLRQQVDAVGLQRVRAGVHRPPEHRAGLQQRLGHLAPLAAVACAGATTRDELLR